MNTYSPTYSDDDDEMGDIVEAYAEQEAADRPTDTDNARRRHLAEMTRQAFADGLYETSAADYAEALRRARAETTTATIEDTARAIHRALAPRWMSVAQALGPGQDAYEAMLADIAKALADAGLLATARTLPTRDDLARAIASGYEPDHPTPNRHDYRAADAVLALFNEKGD